MSENELDRRMEFSKCIIDGVELKRCRSSIHAYKPHVHNELSLGYIIEGVTDLTLHTETITFSAGDGVIIPPLMTHRCAPINLEQWAYDMLFIDPGYYRDVVCFSQAKKLTGDQTRRLKGFIEQLLAENTPDILESILIELLLEFGGKATSESPAGDTGNIIASVRDYILEHVGDEITLERLQQISGLNKFSIIRLFRKQYMTTPAAFHLQHRVAEAKNMLGKGADVFDICQQLRFYDQAHLIREFKKMYGVTPAAYLEQLKA